MYFLLVPKESTKEKAPLEAALRVRSLTQEKSAPNLTRSATLRSDKIARLSDFSFPRSPASRGPCLVRSQAIMKGP